MRNLPKTLAVVAAVAAAGLLTSACGGSKDKQIADLQEQLDAMKAQQGGTGASGPGAPPAGASGATDWSWASGGSGGEAPPPMPAPDQSQPNTVKPPKPHHRSADAGSSPDTSGQGTNLLSSPPPEPPKPAAPSTVARTLSSGTSLPVRLDGSINSGSSHVGDPLSATLSQDVADSAGHVVLPAGTKLSGQVTAVQPARKVHKKSMVAFRFTQANLPDGTSASISAGEQLTGKGWTGKQGAIIGGSAAGGALLGQVVGHNGGSTAAGALIGGAIAAGVISSRKGEDVGVAAGTLVDLPLDTAATIQRPQ